MCFIMVANVWRNHVLLFDRLETHDEAVLWCALTLRIEICGGVAGTLSPALRRLPFLQVKFGSLDADDLHSIPHDHSGGLYLCVT